ncbi:MAG TPA: LLM class flavin-dependent oxidoreductase [Actinomycetota bacterium]|nr:LLM class flavin-dependent oxidoreductase [Actinomycetota bacterium]
MSGVRLGVTLPQFTDDAAVFTDGARRAEDLGFDSLWVFDHLWPLGNKKRPILEGWTSLAWAAARTTRPVVGTLVTRSSLRHPAILARMAATVSAVAPGRLCVAVGSGDSASAAENLAFGLPYWSGADRMDQLESTVEVLHRSRAEGDVSFEDDFASLDALPPGPGPRDYSIWVAGRSVDALDVAGRLADGWNAWAASPEEFAHAADALRAIAGERPVELTWGGQVIVDVTDDAARARLGSRNPARFVVGGPETVGRYLRSLADAGAAHVVVATPFASDPSSYELLAGPVRAAAGFE